MISLCVVKIELHKYVITTTDMIHKFWPKHEIRQLIVEQERVYIKRLFMGKEPPSLRIFKTEAEARDFSKSRFQRFHKHWMGV